MDDAGPADAFGKHFMHVLNQVVLLLVGALIGCSTGLSHAETPAVVTAPAPAGEPLPTDYEVSAMGRNVAVYGARVLDPPFANKGMDYGGPYSFANFDMTGKVTVRITSKRSLNQAVVRPSTAVAKVVHEDDHTLVLTFDKPAKVSVEPDGKKGPLLLFANPMEENKPATNAPGVVYFGPGIHKPTRIELTNDQTLYIAAGAVVKGAVIAHGNNIRITGRGILDGSDWEWTKGPNGNLVDIRGTNVEVSGITMRGAYGWTIVPRDSSHVVVRDVKLCGSRVQNDDGIDPCNSQDVLVSNCFFRTDDDCVALKGLEKTGPNSNVEQITVENSVLWCDRARIFLLGHESRAAFMRQIEIRNVDIIHFTMTCFLFEPGEDMHLEQVRVQDVRLHGEGQHEFIRLKPTINQYMRTQTPGFVSNVVFKNVSISGGSGDYLVQLEGATPEHNVQNVTFDNVVILDQPLTRESPRMQIGKHVKDLHFGPEKP